MYDGENISVIFATANCKNLNAYSAKENHETTKNKLYSIVRLKKDKLAVWVIPVPFHL